MVLTCSNSHPVDSEPDYLRSGTPCSVKLPPGKQPSSGQGLQKGHKTFSFFQKDWYVTSRTLAELLVNIKYLHW